MIRFLGWGVGNGVLCFSLGSRVRGNDVGNDVVGGTAVNYGHPPARCARVPLRGAKGGEMASAGMTWGGVGVNYGHPPARCARVPLRGAKGGDLLFSNGIFRCGVALA